jgi:hypothetical protein
MKIDFNNAPSWATHIALNTQLSDLENAWSFSEFAWVGDDGFKPLSFNKPEELEYKMPFSSSSFHKDYYLPIISLVK